MAKLSENLKLLMQNGNINTTTLAREIDMLQPVLHRIVKGGTDNPRIQTLLPIAKFFNVTIEQLIGEDPLKLDETQNDDESLTTQNIPILDDWSNIINFIKATNNFSASSYIPFTTEKTDGLYAVKVKDSTMLPKFEENTILIVNPSLSPKNRDFVIVTLPDRNEPVFKQIFYDGAEIHLKPLNPEFKTTIIKTSANYDFLGVVVEMRTEFYT